MEASKPKTLIIGFGEIGSSLHQVLKDKYEIEVVDPEKSMIAPEGTYDVMHICFPPIANFVKVVQEYKDRFKPRYTVIHSTVPVGTSKKCGAYHSLVRGVHPNIAEGIKTFPKYLGPSDAGASYLEVYFNYVGVPIQIVDKAETSEAAKLWDTTYYGWNIIFEKLLHAWCLAHDVDYNIVYKQANESYNEGYAKLGRNDVQRPVLNHIDGGIGGHCVIPNLELFHSPVGEFLKKHNERFKVSTVSKGASQSR